MGDGDGDGVQTEVMEVVEMVEVVVRCIWRLNLISFAAFPAPWLTVLSLAVCPYSCC